MGLKKSLKNYFNQLKKELWQYKYPIAISVILLVLAAIITGLASLYVDKVPANSVSDLILDHIPAIDLSFIFSYGFILVFVVMIGYPLFIKIKELHMVLTQLSLLVSIRAIFMTLTHLKIPAEAIMAKLPSWYAAATFNNDLFFSGHVAVPFLGFLIFRKEKIGIFFLLASIIMAATVLLMHVHYSIDVFAAFFITYGCYRLGKVLITKLNISKK